jgi:hypothetical protein
MINSHAIFEVFTAMRIHVEVCWVVTPCSVVIGYQRFGAPWYLHLKLKALKGGNGDIKVLRKADILMQHYAKTQPRRS